MKEYGRKPYMAKSYRDMMDGTPNQDVWSRVLEAQSEFEKPYIHKAGEYQVMQYFHPALPGFTPWRPLDKYDWGIAAEPFNPYDPSTEAPARYDKIIWDISRSPEVISSNSDERVYILHGWPPFKWEVEGVGYELEYSETDQRYNTLKADSTAQGIAKITVTDFFFENQAVGYVYGRWLEDWEGATITSNHNWVGLTPTGDVCAGTPNAALYNFGGNNVIKLVSCADTGEISETWPYVDLRTLSEIPLDLGLYSGFTGQMYIDSVSIGTEPTQALCETGCTGEGGLLWRYFYEAYLTFLWRAKGSPNWYDDISFYGKWVSYGCTAISPTPPTCTYAPTNEAALSYAQLVALSGSWFTPTLQQGSSAVPWGNSAYELTAIAPYARTGGMSIMLPVSFNVYFGDLVITAI